MKTLCRQNRFWSSTVLARGAARSAPWKIILPGGALEWAPLTQLKTWDYVSGGFSQQTDAL